MSLCRAEGNPHEAAGTFRGIGCRRSGNLSLNDAVGEVETGKRRELLDLELRLGGHGPEPALRLLGQRQPKPLLALVRGWLGGHVVQADTVGALQRIPLDLCGRAASKHKRQRGRENQGYGASHAHLQ
jgi:hypothetical protein